MLSLIQDLSKKHADVQSQKQIERILNSTKLGLLINERFVNIPAKISDPLLSSLMTEIDRMQKKDPSYAFQYFIMICKLHKPKDGKGTANIVSFLYNFKLSLFRGYNFCEW